MSDLAASDHVHQSSLQDEEESAAPGKPAKLPVDEEAVTEGNGDLALGRMELPEDAAESAVEGTLDAVQAEREGSLAFQDGAARAHAGIGVITLNNGDERSLDLEEIRAEAAGDLGHDSVDVEDVVADGASGEGSVGTVVSSSVLGTGTAHGQGKLQVGTEDALQAEAKAQDGQSEIGPSYFDAECKIADSAGALGDDGKGGALPQDSASGSVEAPIAENGTDAGEKETGAFVSVEANRKADPVLDWAGSADASSPGIVGESVFEPREHCSEEDSILDTTGIDEPGSVKEDTPEKVRPLEVKEVRVKALRLDVASSEEVKSGYDKEADSSMDSTANSAAKPNAHDARVSQEEANSSSSEDSASSRPQTRLQVHDQPKKRIDLRHQFVREIVKIQHDREQFEKQVQAEKQNAASVSTQDARNAKHPGRRQGRGPPTRPPAVDDLLFQVGATDRLSEGPVHGSNVEKKVSVTANKGRAAVHSQKEREAEEVNYTIRDSVKDDIHERSYRARTRSSKPNRFMPIYRPPSAREAALIDDEAEGEDVADSDSVGYDQNDELSYFVSRPADLAGVADVDNTMVKGKDKGVAQAQAQAQSNMQAGNRRVRCVDPLALEEETEGLGIKITLDTTRHQRFVEYLDPAAETEASKFIITIPGGGPSHNSDARSRGAPSKGIKNEGIGFGSTSLDRATINLQPTGPSSKASKQEGMGSGSATFDRATIFVHPPGPSNKGTKQESIGSGSATLDRATILLQPPGPQSKPMKQEAGGSRSATLDRATIFVQPSGPLPSSFQFNARPEDKLFDINNEKGKGFASSDRGRAKRGKNRSRERGTSQGVLGKGGQAQLARTPHRARDQVYAVPVIIPPREGFQKQRVDALVISEERSREEASTRDLPKPPANQEQPSPYPRISGRWGDVVEDVQEAVRSPPEVKLENRNLQAHRRWGDDSDTEEVQEAASPRTIKRGRVKTAASSFHQVDSGGSSVDSVKIEAASVRHERFLVKDADVPSSDPRKRDIGNNHHQQGKTSIIDAQASHKTDSSSKKTVWERLGPQKESSRIRSMDDQLNSKAGTAVQFSSQDWRKYKDPQRDSSAALLHDESKEGLSSGHGSNAESDFSHISEDSAEALLLACKDSKQKRSKFELYVPRRGFPGS